MPIQIEGQLSIFDFLEGSPVLNKKEVFNPLREFAKLGSGFKNGKIRILNKFAETSDKKERVNFLIKEYGIGGFLGPRKGEDNYEICGADWCMPMSNNKIDLKWYIPGEREAQEGLYTFNQLHDAIAELIHTGEY